MKFNFIFFNLLCIMSLEESVLMITNFNKTSKKDDAKLLTGIIIVFLFVAWLCTPPGNKFLQVCFWGNNTKMLISKITHNSDDTEYIFHRNNAVYLAKMYPDKKRALREMNKAIETLPSFAPEAELKTLYKERAMIRLMAGDYKASLSDYINSDDIQFNDYLRVAMLFKEAGNYREAMRYCNNILETDSTAYAGYACLSELYTSLGRYDVAVNIWNLAIDRKPNNPRAYVDRAKAKKQMGDVVGYDADIAKAREYSPTLNLDDSIIEDTLHPKILNLPIR